MRPYIEKERRKGMKGGEGGRKKGGKEGGTEGFKLLSIYYFSHYYDKILEENNLRKEGILVHSSS